MRVMRGILFVSVAWVAMSAPALTDDDKHLLLGTWSVDVTKIQQPNPPKSVTLTLAEAGDDTYRITVTIEAADGSKTSAEGTFKPDGSASRPVGNLDTDVVSSRMPSRRVLVMGGGFQGKPSSSRVFSLSDDGTHMIETTIRHLPDGTPYTRTFTWLRR
jgi:hypothetical protein